MSDWYLKLILLSVGAAFVVLIALSNWEKYKKYIVYLLIALFAQTGFAYQIKPGYFTSAAEFLYFGLLIIMGTAWLKNKSSVPDIGLKKPIIGLILKEIVFEQPHLYAEITFEIQQEKIITYRMFTGDLVFG